MSGVNFPKKVRTPFDEAKRTRRVAEDARLGKAEMERDSMLCQLKQDEREQLESVKDGACVCE